MESVLNRFNNAKGLDLTLQIGLASGEVDAGTAVGEGYFLELERRVFLELCQQKNTADRIEHMLKTGKPLRN